MRQHKSLGIFFISIGYLITGLLYIPLTLGAFSTYTPGALTSDHLVQLTVLMLVLVVIPFFLAYTIWKGYRIGWLAGILFAGFEIILYLITFSSLNIQLSNGILVSSSAIAPLSYSLAYSIVYLGTYLIAVIEILLNIGLIYFLTRKRNMAYFGL